MDVYDAYSGVGKSTIVESLRPFIEITNGIFCSGKFDQLLTKVPFSAIGWALQDLTTQLPEKELRLVRTSIRNALDDDVDFLASLVPDIYVEHGNNTNNKAQALNAASTSSSAASSRAVTSGQDFSILKSLVQTFLCIVARRHPIM